MANDHPRRRKTDKFNGKIKAWGVGVGWVVTLALLAFNTGVHSAVDDEQGRLIETNREAIATNAADDTDLDREIIRDVGELTAAVDALTENVRQLQLDLREHDRGSQ